MHLSNTKWFLWVGIAMFAGSLLSGCSVDLTKYDQEQFAKTIPFFEPITLSLGDSTYYLGVNLQRAYTAAIDTASYPMQSCRGVAHITASVITDKETSAWGIGATVVPFWPALPVNEIWRYSMDARIFCNGSLTFKATFEEEEHVEAFFYGKMRADLVNDASQAMHKKLLERLKFETGLKRATDLNSTSDY